jgi:hypothetical protein
MKTKIDTYIENVITQVGQEWRFNTQYQRNHKV